MSSKKTTTEGKGDQDENEPNNNNVQLQVSACDNDFWLKVIVTNQTKYRWMCETRFSDAVKNGELIGLSYEEVCDIIFRNHHLFSTIHIF